MPRNITSSRLVAEVDLDISKIPDANSVSDTSYTWRVIVPKRGIVHRATLIMCYDSATPPAWSGDKSAIYVLSSATDQETGTTPLTEAETKTIIAQSSFFTAQLANSGGHRPIGSSLHVATYTLDFNRAGGVEVASSSHLFQGNSEAVGFFYDISTQLGPVSGTGDLFFTWVAQDKNYQNGVVWFKCRLEIEPVQ
jgi:hypothetical protein